MLDFFQRPTEAQAFRDIVKKYMKVKDNYENCYGSDENEHRL